MQWTSAENETLDLHDEALRDDWHLPFVLVSGEDRKQQVAHALPAAGGHALVHFGRFTTEKNWL